MDPVTAAAGGTRTADHAPIRSDDPAASLHAAGRATLVRTLGPQPYTPVWRAMQRFTDARDSATVDELWVVEHAPVFTLGQAGKPEHLLLPGDIPVVHVDRGGQVTYHGPGQLVLYPLLDIARLGVGVREYVCGIEQAIIDTLAEWGVSAARRAGAPGVYVGEAKIAALGIRVRHGRTFHGLALNVAMDLAPFARINPCGYAGLAVTALADCVTPARRSEVGLLQVAPRLLHHVAAVFGLTLAAADARPVLAEVAAIAEAGVAEAAVVDAGVAGAGVELTLRRAE